METKKTRILVVDDKEESRCLLESLLKGVGHEVTSTGNGTEALEELQAQDFDIIVTDILMPGMDGFQLCMQVKQDERLRGIPLVFYTATYTDEHDKDLALAMGAHKFIRKPMEPAEFSRILSEVLAEVRESGIRTGAPFLEKQEILFQRYNERVVNKLGQKIHQLEQEIAERKKTEEALKSSEERYKAVVDNVEIGISVLNPNMELVEINKAFQGYFPHVRPGVGQICYEHYNDPPRSAPCSYCPCVLTLQDGEVHEAVKEFPAGTEIRNLHLVSSPIKDSDGRVQYVVELAGDITERKRAEETQHRLNRELQAISSCQQVLMRAVDEQTLLNDICRIICDEAGYRLAWVGYAENDDAKTVRPVAWAGFDSGYIAKAKLSWADDTERGRGPAGTAIRSGEVVYVQDFATDPRMAPWRENALHRGYRSGIALPLKDEYATVFGVLLIYASESNAITPEEIRLIERLADDLAFGISALQTRAQRKQAEEALIRANTEWERTFRAISQGIMVLDDQYRIVRANRAISDALGMGESELIGRFCFELVHGEQVPPSFCPYSQLLADGEEHSAEVNEPRLGAILDVRVSPIHDQKGQVIGSVHVTRNITKRKEAEAELQRSNDLLHGIIEAAPTAIIGMDLDGNVRTVWNASAEKMFGCSAQEVMGYPLPNVPVDRQEEFRELRERVRSGKTLDGVEVRWQRRDGTPIDYSIYASPLHNEEGWITGNVAVLVDITEKKSLQSQLLHAQKMEAIGTLAGGIAHDFNNMLQVVLGCSDLLIMKKSKDSSDLTYLEAIRKAVRDTRDLVKGLLAFSRKARSEMRLVELSQHLKQMQGILKRTIPRMIEIRLIIADDLRAVNADPVQMEQVLMNLAVNAAHAMPEGGILTIEAENVTLKEDYCRTNVEATPGEYVMLKISDTGCGIDRKVMEHIFEPFYTTKEDGTGLGLSIAYGIVKNHDGHITCSSEPGQGTTFSIYFPAVPLRSDTDMAYTSGEPIVHGSETILVVDDEEDIRKTVGRILTACGYKIFRAENGRDAQVIYRDREHEIDLVVLDLNMPGMSGMDCLAGILRINPKAKVLIASGYPVNESTKRVLDARASGFIGKPFDAADLLRTVRKILDEPGSRESRLDDLGPVSGPRAEDEVAQATETLSPTDSSSLHEVPQAEESPLRPRILAIDDRETYLKMLEAGLAQFGLTPLTASSGLAGLRVFRKTPVDLVVCDLGMPGLDGWAVGKRIKEICEAEGVPKTPFIMLTGQADMEDEDQEVKEKMADCGVDAIVGKPVDVPDLLEVMKRLVKKSCGGEE